MSLDPATVIRRMGVVASQVASQATATATTPLSVMVPGGAAEQDAALADFQHSISRAFAASPTWTGEGAKVIDDHLPQIVGNDAALQLLAKFVAGIVKEVVSDELQEAKGRVEAKTSPVHKALEKARDEIRALAEKRKSLSPKMAGGLRVCKYSCYREQSEA